jgi:hypothetical protein
MELLGYPFETSGYAEALDQLSMSLASVYLVMAQTPTAISDIERDVTRSRF